MGKTSYFRAKSVNISKFENDTRYVHSYLLSTDD